VESGEQRPCCCCCAKPWVVGSVGTAVGTVLQVGTALQSADRRGAWKMRWGIARMSYAIEPGLYAVGQPGSQSPVLVSANYKMSFDSLRSHLAGLDAWILVIDTKGINVWCAAGKGTFGTEEIVGRVASCRLSEVVSHRTLIVPQLGAPGVAAHEVRKQSGFRVVYGPVRAADIPAFLAADMRATPQMRRVEFPLRDRLAVVAVDLMQSAMNVVLVAAAILALAGLGADGYSVDRLLGVGIPSAACFLAMFMAAAVLMPALLPWIPGRALATKGAWTALALLAALAALSWMIGYPMNEWTGTWTAALGWALLVLATSSYMAMKYTGATTYTSLSGVYREMRVAVPVQAIVFILGMVLWIACRFV
jgi:hypothetical protein